MRRILCVFLAVSSLVLSCTRPDTYEKFVPAPGTEDNIYLFDIDLSDSTSLYDVSFYTKVDTPVVKPKRLESFKMHIFWVSPSDIRLEETVYYPSWETIVPYRTGIKVSEAGEWRLAIQITDPPKSLRGLGVIVKRK